MNLAFSLFMHFVLPAAITIAFALLLVNSFYGYYLGYASCWWPTTECVVTESAIRESCGKHGIKYRAHVSYKYLVDGKSFSNDVISAGYAASASRKSNAQEIADEFPTGKQRTVWYNPANPNVAVLATGVTWNIHVTFAIGLFGTAAGTRCFWLSCRKWQTNA